MCIIVLDTRDTKERISKDILHRCMIRNPDGMGIMYASNKSLITWTTLKDFDGLWNRYTHARDRQAKAALHFRIGTKGKDDLDNCHPFNITENFAFMHNGTISWLGQTSLYGTGSGRSDTSLIRDIFAKLPSGFLADAGINAMVKDSLSGDRMVFMDAAGNHSIINEYSGYWYEGNWKGGVWFSHDKAKDYIVDGMKPKQDVGFNRDWEGDYRASRPNGHLRSCKCLVCKNFDKRNTKKHSDTCKCLDCKRTKEKKNKPTGKIIHHIGNKVVTDDPFPAHLEFYLNRSYPKTPNEANNLIFGYGAFRHDLGSLGIPPSAKHIARGKMEQGSLWALDHNGTELAAGFLESRTSKMTIQGDVYALQGDIKHQLARFDVIEGCDYGDPEGSAYHRFIMPVRLEQHTTVWCWVYMANPDIDEESMLGPVPFGDWVDYLDKIEKAKAEENKPKSKPEALKPKLLAAAKSDKQELSLIEENKHPCPICKSQNTLTTTHNVESDTVLRGMKITSKKNLYCHECEVETVINVAI